MKHLQQCSKQLLFADPLNPWTHGTMPVQKSAISCTICTNRELCTTKFDSSCFTLKFQENRQNASNTTLQTKTIKTQLSDPPSKRAPPRPCPCESSRDGASFRTTKTSVRPNGTPVMSLANIMGFRYFSIGPDSHGSTL